MAAFSQNDKTSYPGFGKPSNSAFGQAKPAMAAGNEYGAGKAAPYAAYRQGQAQATPQQSQGAPYTKPGFEKVGEIGTADMRDYYNPATGKTTQTSAGNYQPVAGSGWVAGRPPTSQSTGDPRGAYATAAPDQRPPPFQMSAAQTPWGQSMDPFAERDAFVNQINQQRMQRQVDFNSGGMPPPGSDFRINYQQAAQQAGLGGGAPSMSPEYGDSMIGRLNQSFGGQGDSFAYQPQQYAPSQQGYGQAQSPGLAPPSYYQPPAQSPGRAQPMAPQQPGYGTPPDRRDMGRTADWRDADRDGVDDRDQDGPGMPAYRSGQPQPIARSPSGYKPTGTVGPPPMPPSGPANPYGPPVIDRPAPRPLAATAKDPNRAAFLQKKASGLDEGVQSAATYDDYVKSGLDNAAGRGLTSEREFYAEAARQGVAPGDEWFAAKTGKSGAAGKTQYFNDAMARYQSKQSGLAAKGQYQESMDDKYLRNRYGYGEDRPGFRQAMTDYESGRPQAIDRPGNAQPIQPRAEGMPYDYGFNLPPGTTPADIQQSYNARMAARENAPPPWMQPAAQAFTSRPWQTRR